jgi:hypothetical protein
MWSTTCIYNGVQLKSKLQHTGTWSAAAWPPHRLCYRLAVFFGHLRLTALLFLQSKIRRRFHNCYYFSFAYVWNCVSRNASVNAQQRLRSISKHCSKSFSLQQSIIVTLLQMSSTNSKWQDFTGKFTSESHQISRFVFCLLAPNRCIDSAVWEDAMSWSKYDFTGQTFRTYQRKLWLLKVPVLERQNIWYGITNFINIKKTARLDFFFGSRILVFTNPGDTGLRQRFYP